MAWQPPQVEHHPEQLDPTLDEAKNTVAMTRVDAIWEQLFPAEQQRIVRLLIDKVIVSPNDIEVRFRPNGIEVLAMDLRPDKSAGLPICTAAGCPQGGAQDVRREPARETLEEVAA
ncbi:hypothetical protein [Sulfurivermis fontis]|uniref:hypothetical protein n=1 Tax=Sulfurivermis fontis TaxID=1972068 RepID=UPI0018D4F3ED|nr:hypothetical protein [Sulfurivermis fontis]